MDLKRLVEDSDTRAGRAFDLVIQGLVVVSLISFSIDTLPGLSPAAHRVLDRIEIAVVAAFTVEYLLRLWLAPSRLGFVFSFFGLVDLLAILPFYLSLEMDLRSIRVVRLFRLFRLLKFVRYSRAIRRYRVAFALAREELALFGAAAMILLYVSAVGIYFCERDAQPETFASIFHSLWWAVVTLTTVGYGDVYPVTVAGRILTSVVLLLGLGIVAVPTGLFASALSQARRLEDEGREDSVLHDDEDASGPPDLGSC